MTIYFKLPELVWEFDVQLHPAARGTVTELARMMERQWHLPLTVTAVCRSPAEMASIYGRDWRERGRWSWHLVNRAVDLRNRDWTDPQKADIELWLQRTFPDAEIIMHNIGRGDHLHVAMPAPASRLRRLQRYIMRARAAKQETTK